MSRARFLILVTGILMTGCATATADTAISVNPRWTPIPDEVYLQEVGSRVLTGTPLLDVAVFRGAVYVATPQGVLSLQGDDLNSTNGPRSSVSRLVAAGDALWAVAADGLWRNDGNAWTQVETGQFTDVASHASGVIVASPDHVFEWRGTGLESLNSAPPAGPILGVASYSETVYVLHADRVGFLQDGQFNYGDVQDWGSIPQSAATRDVLALGSELLVPTDRGLAVLRGTSWHTVMGEEGLCYEDTTCVAEGFGNDYWVGTTRGAIRVVDGSFHYFGHERWLPDDRVNGIACSEDTAYIATNGGLGIIRYEPYTLQKKSAWYKRWMEEWGMKRLGFVNTLIRNADGSYTRFLSDNDVGWACHYLDALCFEYAVTGDPDVRGEAVDVFKTVKWSEEITPIPGFPARAIYAVGEDAVLAATGSAGRPSEWNRTADNQWEWKGDTSSDEVIAQIYTTTLFHDLVAEGAEKDAAREHLERMVNHIIDNGWTLRDLDGKPTVWARWEPEFIYSPQHTDELGLNSLQALAMVAAAEHVIGGQKYKDAKQQLYDWKYPENVLRQKKVSRNYTPFDDRLAFLAYFPLLRYETDLSLRAVTMRSLQRSWEIKRVESQPWFNYVYGAVTGNAVDNTRAVQHLREYPLDCTNYRFTNSHRHDLHTSDGYTNYLTDTKPMGPREQGIRRWDRDPLELDGGGGEGILDPSSYLDAYWMGRYFGFISPPTTTDSKLLTVEDRDEHHGAPPYDGLPRPHIF